MSLYFQFLLLGIGAGVIIGALAVGLVMSFRASGVINFGHGAIATYVSYVYAGMRQDGVYPIPPLPNPLAVGAGILGWFGISVDSPDIPTMINFGDGTSTFVAVFVALATAVGLGLAAHLFVFRALRYAPATAKLVASVGILLTLQSVVVLRYGSTPRRVDNLLPTEAVSVFGTDIPVDRFILLGMLLIVTFVLSAGYRYTRFGIATRAAAENEQTATLLGISVDRQAVPSWIMSAVLAGGVGILVSPITGLTPGRMTIFLIPAVGAALVGAFSSFWAAALTGLAIGMVQSVLFLLEQQQDWVPDLNLPQVLPLVVIAAVMTLRGDAIPGRGAVQAERLPFAYAGRVRPSTMAGFIAITAVALIYLPFSYRNGLTNSMIGILLALSLVVVTGFVGQVSLVQIALSGIAAFGIASFVADAGMPFLVGFALAILVSTGFGLVMGLMALRSRGPSLAIVTLAAGIAIEAMLFNRDGWFGTTGVKSSDPPSVLGVEFGPSSEFFLGDDKLPTPGFGLFVLVVTAVGVVLVSLLRRSPFGEQMLAVRSNERAASAAGVDVAKVKLAAFAIGAALAGAAGALKAEQLGSFRPATFAFFGSLVLLALAYLGGISSVTGALWTGTLVGGGIGVVIGEEFIALGRYEAYIAGVFLLIELTADADGIATSTRKMSNWVRKRWRVPRNGSGAAPTPQSVPS